MYFEGSYPIDSRDVDPWNHCKPSGLMGTKEFTIAGAKNFLGRFRTRGKEG